jgi:hypothetical protein
MENNSMGRFFDWLAKPMDREDITAWYLANNITPELTELFRDFCISFLHLLDDTYLGGDDTEINETKVGMSTEQKKEHFKWCWDKTIQNFQKEDISFTFNTEDSSFFEAFFFDVFYSQSLSGYKTTINTFFTQIFDYKYQKTKSDIEIFTDIYKLLERSLKIKNTSLQN